MSVIGTIRQNISAGMAATVVEINAGFATDRVTVWRDRPGEFYGVMACSLMRCADSESYAAS